MKYINVTYSIPNIFSRANISQTRFNKIDEAKTRIYGRSCKKYKNHNYLKMKAREWSVFSKSINSNPKLTSGTVWRDLGAGIDGFGGGCSGLEGGLR